jgi:DUF917 family protein
MNGEKHLNRTDFGPTMEGRQFLTVEDLNKLVTGATIFGSAGGGPPASGRLVVEAIGRIASRVPLWSLAEVPDEAVVAAVCGFGSPEVLLKRVSVIQNVLALETLERAIGKKVDYLIPYESGGYNSLVPFHVAASKGLPVLDCDGTGRAVCEWYISMFEVHHIPMSPFALADDQGHSGVIYADNTVDADKYGRALLREFGLSAGTAEHVMSGAKARASMVPGMLTMEHELGASMEAAMARGHDSLDVVLDKTHGFLLIEGKVAKKELRTSPVGSDHGRIEVKGNGRGGQRVLQVYYKNESILARWSDGTVATMLPDLISYLDREGKPMTNADLKEGMDIRVLGIPIHPRCRAPEALSLYAKVLKDTLAFEGPYISVEHLQGESGA